MTQKQEYIEHSERTFCDFCAESDPTMIWSLPEGDAVDQHLVSAKTGKIIESLKDADGRWAACPACHKALLTYKKSAPTKFALKRFVSSVCTRMKSLEDQWTSVSNVKQRIKQQSTKMFRPLLPNLSDPRPVRELINERAPLRAVGDKETIESIRAMRGRMNREWDQEHLGTDLVRKSPALALVRDMMQGRFAEEEEVIPDIPDGQTQAVSPRRLED